ncbi:ATP-dependent RNA helicase HrpA [Hydrocarboniclastica marina]|uniref:ATP-dependent RNA helicase HrpA n=1 Tax=Hydrocarboniclastica marina TaxID=2259620 RepID=A0A4P7XHT9_9ALTE|nr:ATP-dependent RNA helicase HrpA [Hydrocarboniclastica marina]QCF26243.1 ATP-dependent RNA helicase HrpA [Hydrocarboniclastica marina]
MTWQPPTDLEMQACRQREAGRIRQQLARARGKPDEATRKRIDAWLAQGQEAFARRQDIRPHIEYPPELPVSEHAADLRELIEKHQVVVVAGETGSGKTTQLPKICLDAGRGRRGLIGHTQPRRLAARNVASRLAEELQTQVGEQVGFQVRFSDQTSENSLMKVMTDGILLAEIQRDRMLDRYDTLIIDEAHERSLNIDFLLGYLKQLLPKRPDLRVVITSATIEVERFSRFFNGAPVVEVSGRTYPVDVFYRPPANRDDDGDSDSSWAPSIIECLAEIARYERAEGKPVGDVLVFLPGEREIRQTSKALRHAGDQDAALRHADILPLYARLSTAEQQRVFQSHTGRRIVLSTNVAETSLTVPGIRYVIDSGLARISRYSVRSKIQRLPIEAVSQASANQRKGRCGRVAPGLCFRLYEESDFLGRPEFTDPEIRRTNLASVILQMALLGLGEIRRFPFLDGPDQRQVNDGFKLLEELGAVDARRRLTETGRSMARLPVDPRLARMLLAAEQHNALAEVQVIASGLSVQDPRERPADRQQASDQAHGEYADKVSDFVSLVNLWRLFEQQRQELSQNQLRKWCQKRFLNYMRMREWRDVHRQLVLVAKEQGMTPNAEPAGYDGLHKALLTGLLGQVAIKEEKREYQGTRNRKLMIFPGSSVAKSAPKWIMAAEIVETSRVFARTVAKIDVEWIEPLAGHLVKRSYFEPHWEQKRAQVVGYERVTLYGLELVPRRSINYSRIDPSLCRELFIRRALVEGEYQSKAGFLTHNREMVETVEKLEEKTRRRDILIDEEGLFQFYDQRLPADIVSGRHFESWWRQLSDDEARAFYLTEADVLQRPLADDTAHNFPDQLQWQGISYRLDYYFEPGQSADGVTMTVPLMALKQLPVHRLGWLVPGLLREKCIHLVRSLPKSTRKNFVPVPDFVDAALGNLTPSNEPLGKKLGEQLTRMTGVAIPHEQWQEAELPPHLRMNIRLVDYDGKTIEESRDILGLLEKHEQAAQVALARQVAKSESQGEAKAPEARAWAFGKLPVRTSTDQGGVEVTVFPALEDLGNNVRLTQRLDAPAAEEMHRRGLARLLLNRLQPNLDGIDRKLPKFKASALLFAPLGKAKDLLDDLLMASVQAHFLPEDDLPRSQNAMDEIYDLRRGDFHDALVRWDVLAHEIIARHHEVAKALKGKINIAMAQSLADLKFQLSQLVHPGFLSATPATQLSEFPRYLQAAAIRHEKMPREMGAERVFLHDFQPRWDRYAERMAQLERQGVRDKELIHYRWMLEEYRVSYFAQQLGTRFTVSLKRLDRQWESVRV